MTKAKAAAKATRPETKSAIKTMSKSAYIRTLSETMDASDAVVHAKKHGVTITASLVYIVRAAMRKKKSCAVAARDATAIDNGGLLTFGSATAPPTIQKAPERKPLHKLPVASQANVYHVLECVASEIGFAEAIRILTERRQVILAKLATFSPV